MGEETKIPPHTRGLMRRLWRDYISRHRGRVALALLAMAIGAAAMAGNAWLLQPALDEIFVKQNRTMLALIPAAILALAIINAGATYFQNLALRAMGQRIIATMQEQLYAHLLNADLGLFHDNSSGKLIARFTNDIYVMRYAVSNVISAVIRDALTLIFLTGVMIYQSPALAGLALIAFPLMIFPIIKLGRRLRKATFQSQEQLGHFASQLDETFQGVRMVKAYGRIDWEIARAKDHIERLYRIYVKALRSQAAAAPLTELITGAAIAGVVWYGGVQVMEGETTPGAFFSFIAAMLMAYKPAKSLATLNTNLQEGMAAAQRLFSVLDTRPSIVDAPGARPLALERGDIRFKKATFRYGIGEGGIEDVTLDVPAGKTVALVGPSGSGKTTLVNLLLRFYDLQSGSLTIDGQEIRGVTLGSLRKSMALVAQDVVLFDASIRDNIAYGRDGASEEEIIQAAKNAAAHDFIMELPRGYDTVIGPHGVKLSGGQRQRLSIARAMLKDAPILLLDEATSALDSASERQVQEALEVLMRGRTTLVVAHRLSTIRNADSIVVLERGRIVEQGSHAELLEKGGAYAALHAHQFAPEEMEAGAA